MWDISALGKMMTIAVIYGDLLCARHYSEFYMHHLI